MDVKKAIEEMKSLSPSENAIETILQTLENSVPKKKIKNVLIEKQRERKPYYKQNMIMLKFVDKESAEITKKDLEINDKSMQLYGSIKTLQELLEDKSYE